MSTISYRKLEKKDIGKFIEMRLNQLQEEGAEPLFDLEPALNEYYEKHFDDGTFVSWLAIDGEEIIATSGAIQITASNMGVLLYMDYGFEKSSNFMQLKIK